MTAKTPANKPSTIIDETHKDAFCNRTSPTKTEIESVIQVTRFAKIKPGDSIPFPAPIIPRGEWNPSSPKTPNALRKNRSSEKVSSKTKKRMSKKIGKPKNRCVNTLSILSEEESEKRSFSSVMTQEEHSFVMK